jgi:hypothetical protein
VAVLSDADRAELWAEFMRTETGAFGALSKADLRAAVNALDVFFNDNAATINAAIPQPARGALTTTQKARLLMFVIRQRYLKGA